jgi:hypothetical protein
MRLLLLTLFVGSIIYLAPFLPTIPWLPTPDEDHSDTVRKIGELRTQLETKWPWT